MNRTVIPLARGWDPFAPRRSMRGAGESPYLYRDQLNLMVRDGQLCAREHIQDVDDPDYQPNAAITDYAEAADGDGAQLVWRLLDIHEAKYTLRIVLTRRELLIGRTDESGSPDTITWLNATPIYDTGTVSITSGTDAVTGVGTAWSDRAVFYHNSILLGTKWHLINTVNSNTSITLSTAYTGTTLSGSAYTIRRSWGDYLQANYRLDQILDHGFLQYFDGDLYVGGPFGPEGDAVIYRVQNVTGSTFPSTSDIQYLFAGNYDYTGSMDEVGELSYIFGMQVSEDGRVVAALRVPGADPHNSRVRASSSTDPTDWTGAGTSYVRDGVSSQSPVTALGRLGNDFTLHYGDFIELGTLTGNTAAPISWRRSRAEFGAAGPAALVEISGQEYFPCLDGNVRIFNGTTAEILTPSIRGAWQGVGQISSPGVMAVMRGAHYKRRNEYRLWDGLNGVYGYAIQLDTGFAYPLQWAAQFGAMTDVPLAKGVFGIPNDSLQSTWAFPDAFVVGSILSPTQNGLYQALETLNDDTGDFAGDHGGFYFITDTQDEGLTGVLKHVQRVVLVYRRTKSTTGDETVSIDLSYDDGNNWLSESATLKGATQDELYTYVNFDQQSGEKYTIRVTDADELGFALLYLVVYWQDMGPVEALGAPA